MDKGDYRRALNALRGFAAIWVMVYHARYFSDYPWFEIPGVRYGYLGVDFFFVLSGMIISHVYMQPMRDAGWGAYAHFLWLRVARLWPVHAALMAAMLIATLASGRTLTVSDWWDWFTLTAMVRQWFLPEGQAWNSPAWSISAELFAYAFVFPLALYLVRDRSWPQAGRLLCLLGLAVLGVVLAGTGGSLNASQSSGPLLRVIGGFLLGAGLFCLFGRSMVSARWDRAIVGGIVLFGIGAALPRGADLILLASTTALTLGANLSSGRLARMLSCRWLYLLGEWSFALYLVHIPVSRTMIFFARHTGTEQGARFALMVFLVSFVAAAILHKFVEIPSRRYLRDRFERLRPAQSSRVAAT